MTSTSLVRYGNVFNVGVAVSKRCQVSDGTYRIDQLRIRTSLQQILLFAVLVCASRLLGNGHNVNHDLPYLTEGSRQQ